jgi:hypothetical protein
LAKPLTFWGPVKPSPGALVKGLLVFMVAKRILELSELKQIKPPEPIPGTPLISRGFNVIFGPSGHYKSFYALHQALTVAETAQVVYVAAEGSAGFDWRIGAWCEHYKKPSPEGRLRFIPHEVNLLDPDDVQQTIKLIKTKTKKAELIIMDTYARCLVGGDENGAKDPGLAVYQCALIQRAFDCAVSLVHHTNLGGVRERGNTALRGAADIMIKVSTDDGVVRVECDKLKDGPKWPDRFYKFLMVGSSGVLIPSDKQIGGSELTQREIQVLEFLSLEVFIDCGARSNQIAKALNIPETSLYRILSRLESNSHIKHGSRGDPYTITSSGSVAYSQTMNTADKLAKLFPDLDIDVQLP